MTRLGIPIQEPEQSELTEQGESGTTWETVCEVGKGCTSSSEEFGTLSVTLAGPSSLPGSYSGINLTTLPELTRRQVTAESDSLPELFEQERRGRLVVLQHQLHG